MMLQSSMSTTIPQGLSLIWTHLYTLVSTSSMYIMYALNVSQCVFLSVYSVLVYHGYTNINIGPKVNVDLSKYSPWHQLIQYF